MILFLSGILCGVVALPLGAFGFGAYLHLRPKYASGHISAAKAFWFLAPKFRGRSARMHLSIVAGKSLANESLWSLFAEEVNGALLRKRSRAQTWMARLPLCAYPPSWQNAARHLLDLPSKKTPKVPLDADRLAWHWSRETAKRRRNNAASLAYASDERAPCPRCHFIVRILADNGEPVRHDVDGLEPNTFDYWTGDETGIAHVECRNAQLLSSRA